MAAAIKVHFVIINDAQEPNLFYCGRFNDDYTDKKQQWSPNRADARVYTELVNAQIAFDNLIETHKRRDLCIVVA